MYIHMLNTRTTEHTHSYAEASASYPRQPFGCLLNFNFAIVMVLAIYICVKWIETNEWKTTLTANGQYIYICMYNKHTLSAFFTLHIIYS